MKVSRTIMAQWLSPMDLTTFFLLRSTYSLYNFRTDRKYNADGVAFRSPHPIKHGASIWLCPIITPERFA